MERDTEKRQQVPPGSGVMGSAKEGSSPLEITVQRPALNQEGFRDAYVYQRPKSKTFCDKAKKCFAYECSSARLKKGLKARLPVVDCIRGYTKDCILGDVVAGMTVGIMQIPLGMAYAMLGSCPAVTGLYTSFFPVLLYFVFGTSRHISQGTFAITSLMFGKAVDRIVPYHAAYAHIANNVSTLANETVLESGSSHDAATSPYTAIQVAGSICLIAGVLQMVFGFIRLGEVSIYMSDTLISGFTTGAAFLVFTSQFNAFFGIDVPKQPGPLEIVHTYKTVFRHMPESNVATIIVSLITLVVLAVTCELINPWIMPKIKVPIPIELLAVVVGTGVSYGMDFHGSYKMSIVGAIPSGLPMPEAPPAGSLLGDVIGDAIAIAIVTFVISYSLAKIFSKKHSYDINANQEFIAMGIANFASSFFSCFPMCVALSRSMVLESVGGKTQVAGLLSCIVVLIVLVAIAPLFECLPKCVLAAIIVIGIRRMFLQFRDFVHAWKVSKLEALTWMVTFLAVCLISIDIGLGVGVVFSLLTVIIRSQKPYVTTLGWLKGTEVYADTKKYPTAEEEAGIKIYHYGGPILFANSKSFRKTLYVVSGVNPRIVYRKLNKLKKNEEMEATKGNRSLVMIDMSDARSSVLEANTTNEFISEHINQNLNKGGIRNPTFIRTDESASSSLEDLNKNSFGSTDAICGDPSMSPYGEINHGFDHPVNRRAKNTKFTALTKELEYIVVDGSAISFVDFSGVAAILQVVDEYKQIGIGVFLAAMPGPVLDMLDSTGFYDKAPRSIVFPTVRDAVLHAHHPPNRLAIIDTAGLPEKSASSHA